MNYRYDWFHFKPDNLVLLKLSRIIQLIKIKTYLNKGWECVTYLILNAVHIRINMRWVYVIEDFCFDKLWIPNHLYFWLQKLTWNLLILIIFIILIFTKSFIILLIYNHKISFWILFKGLRGFNSWKYDWL